MIIHLLRALAFVGHVSNPSRIVPLATTSTAQPHIVDINLLVVPSTFMDTLRPFEALSFKTRPGRGTQSSVFALTEFSCIPLPKQ